MSEQVEKVVAFHLRMHLLTNKGGKNQHHCTYRACISTDMALLDVTN